MVRVLRANLALPLPPRKMTAPGADIGRHSRGITGPFRGSGGGCGGGLASAAAALEGSVFVNQGDQPLFTF